MTAALLVAALAAPAHAQTHRSAFGLGGGWSSFGDLTPGLETTTQLEPGWLAGAQLETWSGSGRFGIRLNGAYGQRLLSGQPDPGYHVYSADVDLLVRPLRAGRSRWIAPFIALGAGASHFDAGGSDVALGGGAYGEDPVTRAHVLAGFGLDLLPSHRIGLRLEAGDQIILPSVGQSPPSEGMPQVHNPRFQAALQLRTGEVEGRPVYARRPVAPAPAPAPAPRSAPLGEPVPVVAATPSPEPAVDPAEVARLERLMELRGEEHARELSRLEQRVESLEREVRERPSQPSMASAPAPTPARRAEPGERLFTVQIGAFVEVRTAHIWRERLEGRDLPVWLEDYRLRGQPVKRVRVGALPSRAEAEQLGRRLERDYGWSVWIVALDGDAPVPPGAVGSSIAFLSGR